jgi:hypothetical protein
MQTSKDAERLGNMVNSSALYKQNKQGVKGCDFEILCTREKSR